jgi:hypothetical protein
MQEFVDAAVAAAGRSGARIGLIIVEGKATNGVAGPSGVASDEVTRSVATWKAEAERATGQVNDLCARLDKAEKALAAAKTAGPDAAGAAAATEKLILERNALAKELQETKAKLAAAPAAPAGGVPLGAPQPDALPKLRDYKIDILGLDSDIAKKCAKGNIATVGALEDIALDGAKMKDALKLTKDQVTEVHTALLRRSRASDAPAPGGAQASASTGGRPSDVPQGHPDQPWMERLASLRRKEVKVREEEAKVSAKRNELDALKAQLSARWPSARQLDPQGREVIVLPMKEGGPAIPMADMPAFFEMFSKVNAAEHELSEADKWREVFAGQVITLKWCINVERSPAKAPTVDEALRQAGLVHLMETPPQTAAAPPPVGAPASAPATAAAAK